MNINKSKSSPRDAIAGAESTRVTKMIYSFFNLFTILKTLQILRVLRMVVTAPTFSRIPVSWNIKMIKVKITMKKSKTFHASLK